MLMQKPEKPQMVQERNNPDAEGADTQRELIHNPYPTGINAEVQA